MRTLVFGGTGMLGKAVTARWRLERRPVLALGRQQVDITDTAALRDWAHRFQPSVLVNCAAFTRVDDCETEEELATEVNGRALSGLVEVAAEHGALLVHVSSDYVFDGRAEQPIPEDAATAPRSAYGRSKLEGELRALEYERSLVVRASWLFGPGGPNFAATIRRLLMRGTTPLRVVDDQRGRPTYTPFLARGLYDLARIGATGVVHYGNREPVTWHGFATAIARAIAPDAEVLPVSTNEFPRPAERPAYSVLDVSKFEGLVGRAVEPWSNGLVPYLEHLGDSGS